MTWLNSYTFFFFFFFNICYIIPVRPGTYRDVSVTEMYLKSKYRVYSVFDSFDFDTSRWEKPLLCNHLQTLPRDNRQPGFGPAACWENSRAEVAPSALRSGHWSVVWSEPLCEYRCKTIKSCLLLPFQPFSTFTRIIIRMRRCDWTTHAGARAALTCSWGSAE